MAKPRTQIPKYVDSIKVIYQERPFLAAVCHEFHLRVGDVRKQEKIEKQEELESKVTNALSKAIRQEWDYFNENQREIKNELKRYHRIKNLMPHLDYIEEYVIYELTTDNKVADNIQFKQ
jgi:hypothetical protein